MTRRVGLASIDRGSTPSYRTLAWPRHFDPGCARDAEAPQTTNLTRNLAIDGPSRTSQTQNQECGQAAYRHEQPDPE
jgi:hypothetical protein